MPEQWFSYRQLAQHWGITPEAARARAKRGNWQRRTNNAGIAEILIDTDAPAPEPRRNVQGGQTPTPGGTYPQTPETASQMTVAALEAHIATLREQLAKAEALAVSERERVADLTAQIMKLTAEALARSESRRSWWRRLAG